MKNIPTVHELRKKGWKVRVGHFRNFYRFCPRTGKKHSVLLLWKEKEEAYPNYFLHACGGKTVVTITTPDYVGDLVGEAVCSNEELYNRSCGTKKAIARALSTLIIDQKNNGN